MEYALTTKGLSKCYGRFKALDGLDMNVPKGSIYGFIGRNGAGKTTLIRLICGLQEPTDGEYTLYGKSSREKGIERSRRRMGAVVESPAVYLDMTARENIILQYRVLGVPSDDGADELLKLVGLENTGKKKVRNFSLGMRQRLGIAVALAGSPDLLVLDEPINGLDPQGIIEMRELILRLNRERGITVIVSSHILDELSRLATHYGFIDGGHMLREISAEELEHICRKSLRVEVSNVNTLIELLDSTETEYKVISGGVVDIFGTVNITKLVTDLDRGGSRVLHISERDESLESYFISLVGGAEND